MAKTLELNFEATFGPAKISVRNPKESLSPAEIKDAMERMILANVFATGKGNLVSAKNAKVVDRTSQDIELL